MTIAGATWYERLNPVDATFLNIENPRAHMHICCVFVLVGAPPPYRDFVNHVASRLDGIPRYRQRLARVPLDAGRPVWVDDATFRIEHHVRECTLPLPAPSDDALLRRLAARIFAEPLDLRKPLWELTLVGGLGDDRFALLWKTHHCVLDGMAFLQVLDTLTDADASVAAPATVPTWTPRPAPTDAVLLAESVKDQLARAVDVVEGAFLPSAEGHRMLFDLLAGVKPLVGLGLKGRARPSSLNRPIGPHRRWEMPSVPLASVKYVRSILGGTVNDVVLACVAGALRRLLGARGEELRADLRAFIPVNVRPPDARGVSGNQIAAVYCPLPVGEPDPVSRLHKISAAMTRLKEKREVRGTAAFMRLGELVPPVVAAQVAHLEVAYRRFNLIVSNVPGPQAPRYLLGRRLLSIHPGVPLPDEQTLSICALSYAGTIGFGLLADADQLPDLALVARALPEAVSELVSAARSLTDAGRIAIEADADREATASPAEARNAP